MSVPIENYIATPITKIVFLFHFIKDTGIVPRSLLGVRNYPNARVSAQMVNR